MRRRRLEQPVIKKAAGEWRMLPVDLKRNAQGPSGLVDPFPRDEHDRHRAHDRLREMLVLGQQDPAFFGAARHEYAVRKTTHGNNCVVTCRTQPSAKAAKHFRRTRTAAFLT